MCFSTSRRINLLKVRNGHGHVPVFCLAILGFINIFLSRVFNWWFPLSVDQFSVHMGCVHEMGFRPVIARTSHYTKVKPVNTPMLSGWLSKGFFHGEGMNTVFFFNIYYLRFSFTFIHLYLSQTCCCCTTRLAHITFINILLSVNIDFFPQRIFLLPEFVFSLF